MPPESFKAYPLSERAHVITFLSITVFAACLFLTSVPFYKTFLVASPITISEMCNSMNTSGAGRLFFFCLPVGGVCGMLSWMECHLGAWWRGRGTPALDVALNVAVGLSLWGVGTVPYGRFGIGMSMLHDTFAGGTFLLHPVIELMRLLPRRRWNITETLRFVFSATAIGLISIFFTLRRNYNPAAFWVEYSLCWCVVVELAICAYALNCRGCKKMCCNQQTNAI